MASQLQLVIYEGYLGDNPVMQYTASGREVTNFRMASNRKYKTADGKDVKEVIWIKVTAWGKLGEAVNKWCEKGSWVIVSGILRAGKNGSPTPYQTNSGEWAASYEITADKIRILKGKDDAPEEELSSDVSVNSDEIIPF
jgi:single-strand DNA-binding protein